MVRLSSTLFRVPVIKFRKGGGSHAVTPPSSSAATPASAAAAAASSPGQTQQTASMSTISDMDLPPRYRRAPLTQEEIDHINGGGIEQSESDKNDKLDTIVFNMPKNVVLHCKKPARKLMKPPPCGCNVSKAK